jgi:predicted nucleic acid-binding protein
MRFLDANIFIYAYYKPKRQLTPQEADMKNRAKEIVTNLNSGEEEVLTTVVHLSEVANILKYRLPPDELADVISGLLMTDSIRVLGVKREHYYASTELGREIGMDPNDALAVQTMRDNGLTEIYTFDRGFDKIPSISRLPKLNVNREPKHTH